ncbi:hypothetical protein FACS1894218_5750 [Bacilli bacterium]|nr:hypothetical protein FACS1894218_5750 [Bacilli bacterium]
MGVGALNEKVTAKVVRTNLPLDIDPQVATGTQSNEYIATINDGT